MSRASDIPRDMPRPWSVVDIADAVGVPLRMMGDILRDPEAPQVPYFGKLGNNRLYDATLVRSMIPALQAWVMGANQRRADKRLATMKAEAQEVAERQRKLKQAGQFNPAFTDPHTDTRRRGAPPGYTAAEPATPRRKREFDVTADGYMGVKGRK